VLMVHLLFVAPGSERVCFVEKEQDRLVLRLTSTVFDVNECGRDEIAHLSYQPRPTHLRVNLDQVNFRSVADPSAQRITHGLSQSRLRRSDVTRQDDERNPGSLKVAHPDDPLVMFAAPLLETMREE